MSGNHSKSNIIMIMTAITLYICQRGLKKYSKLHLSKLLTRHSIFSNDIENNLWHNVNFYTTFRMSILYYHDYSTKRKFNFLRIQWTMTISIWKGKPCLCFIVKHFSLFYLLIGYIEHLWHEKSGKVSENNPRMSAEEHGRAIGMLQTDCSIRKVKFWKCFMLLR
jgi:hypothetical protein